MILKHILPLKTCRLGASISLNEMYSSICIWYRAHSALLSADFDKNYTCPVLKEILPKSSLVMNISVINFE